MELKGKDFEAKVIQSEKPVLVDFWGSWCIPCKQMEPIVKKLKEELTDVEVYKLNINQNPDTATKNQISGVPSFVIYNQGKEIDRVVGAQTADQLKQFIQKNLT